MAHATTQTRFSFAALGAAIANTLRKISDRFAHAAEAQAQGDARLTRVRALQSKSDAELAALGLTRADIVRQVFHRHAYL